MVVRYCGGSDAFMLTETEMYVRSHGQSKPMGTSWWETLSTDCKGSDQIPFFRQAMIKLALTGHVLTPTAMKKIFTKDTLPKAIAANRCMSMIRELLQNGGGPSIEHPDYTRVVNLLGVADGNMAKVVLGMQPGDGEKKYGAAESVAHDTVVILNSMLGLSMASPWALQAEETKVATGQSCSSSHERMRELNPDGSLKNPSDLLADSGFVQDAFCRRRKDKMECVIMQAKAPHVQLKELKTGGLMKVSMDEFISGQWVVFKPKAEAQVLDQLENFGPAASPDFQACSIVAAIHSEVARLVDHHSSDEVSKSLQLQMKPFKSVIAKANFAKNKLALVPFTFKVLMREKKSDPVSGAVQVVVPSWKMDNREFWLVSCNQAPKEDDDGNTLTKGFISPFFAIAGQEEEDLVNMTSFMSGNSQSIVRFPVLKNSKAISAGDHLCTLRVKEKAESKAPPAKKAKK